ncbi:MAG: L-idonate 5-dehydrogenase [Pseudomonadota bacterium]
MRAVVLHKAKDLRIEERDVGDPGPGQVRVRMVAGGICGSDLHYYQHGGFGAIRVKEPMILGHEVAGVIDAVGPEVETLSVGQPVAISPSVPCGKCVYSQEGKHNHCLNMRFYGSAMRTPHVQGAFADSVVAYAHQCHPVPDSISMNEAAFGEPLAVCLHAMTRAGNLLGRRVLVTGCGPIGALCVAAARRAGAKEIVATDVMDEPLAFAGKVGADKTLNVASDPEALAPYAVDKGQFHVLFECSGNERALVGALEAVRPLGTIVQVGLGGDATLPINTIVAKELQLHGTFRFHEEFGWAVSMISQRLIDVRPLLSHVMDMSEAVTAFDLAGNRREAMKVHLSFDG